MAREQQGTDVPGAAVSQLVQGLSYTVAGVNAVNWFGPSQPLAPQAQDKTEGRRFDFPVGYNLRIQPRSDEIGFGSLRALADGYDLLRLVIETRKDQVESYEWEIVPADRKADPTKFEDDIRTVTDFLQYPDREHSWEQWLRMQVEDLLVIDAIAVYPRATRSGELYALELVDAATIKRLLDDSGRTPEPPSAAYQQILKGIPANDLSRDQLVYTMRNPRTNRVYGLSPVEQIIMTVNIALRRQTSQLDYYTKGNIPEAIAQVPEDWTADTIKDFQTWWDAVLEGNQAEKRKMRFIPRLEGIVFPKQDILKDEYDEWLARIICFAFSIAPSALIKQVNRASGEQMADTAKEEGLLPLQRFLATHMSRLINLYMGMPHLRFSWKAQNKIDPKAQMEVHTGYIAAKVITPDEAREDLGKDAMSAEDREKAFPTPPPMGQEVDEDGKPVPPKMGPDGKPLPPQQPGGFGAKPKEPVPPTEAEKMLADVLARMDPSAVAASLAKAIASLPAPVVNMGDTFVSVPQQPAPVVKVRGDTTVNVPPSKLSKRVVARRDPATGDLVAEIESGTDGGGSGVGALAKALKELED